MRPTIEVRRRALLPALSLLLIAKLAHLSTATSTTTTTTTTAAVAASANVASPSLQKLQANETKEATNQKIDFSLLKNTGNNNQTTVQLFPFNKQTKQVSTAESTPIKNVQLSSKSNQNCSSACSAADFSAILQKIIQNDDMILKRFIEIEESVESSPISSINLPETNANANISASLVEGSFRQSCVRELINMIKGLASNELEMKTMLEFVSDNGAAVSSMAVRYQARNGNITSSPSSGSRLLKSLNFDRVATSTSTASGSSPASAFRRSPVVPLDLAQLKWLQSNVTSTAGRSNGCTGRDATSERDTSVSGSSTRPAGLAAAAAGSPINGDDSGQQLDVTGDKSSVLPKLVANVDHWLSTLERFTVTREWSSLMKVFQGIESILELFVTKTTTTTTTTPTATTNIKESASTKLQVADAKQSRKNNTTNEMIENLKKNLPAQVMTLTSSLNNLFPWHVWPWNNLDLYGTVDTFLNHGIFAFSKTTVGPQRRIDFLPEMLQALFKSLKFDTFPKKCIDWSKIICDFNLFHERIILSPPSTSSDESSESYLKEREQKIKELAQDNKNHLTQELTCIMFSSLSMQHFGGGKEIDEERESISGKKLMSTAVVAEQVANNQPPGQTLNNNKLAWDKQVHKAIKLYTLSREALTDDQWLSLYNIIHDLWSQQKISDRLIMVGRVIQLLTNCHMPKEMLESALWKDIYKYKNVLNQLIDIVVEELNRSGENGKLTIQQIAFGSKHLHDILQKFIKLSPKLVESISQTIVDQLPELVNRVFIEKVSIFKVPCRGYSFSDLVPSLSKYRNEILVLEEMVCKQVETKPKITMMQINNLTNEFLAMALNLGNFSSALPKLLTNFEATPTPQRLNTSTANFKQQQQQHSQTNQSLSKQEAIAFDTLSTAIQSAKTEIINVTSIVDEMAANPRLAQIVAILQSSALDPPEVHAELPELDWVEAGTSVALLYESIQKLISYEEVFTIFPELEGFQEEMKSRLGKSQQMFKKFSKRDPIRLVAYSLDAAMPIALRTFKSMESFHGECLSSFRDIFSEDIEGKATRQCQCLISSMQFASWAINEFMKTFNSMFKNILSQMSAESLAGKAKLTSINKQQQIQKDKDLNGERKQQNDSCIFFDGSVSMILDNLPQFIDLALETVLMASTTSDQQLTLYDIMCSSNYMLDPFNARSVELKAKIKDKMCHLFHKKSLTNCANVLKLDQWTLTMRELNSTWFESNAISINSSFREITINAHEFLELFGQFKPSTMSDSLIARVLNVNSFWTKLLNRIINIIDKYQEKRFEYALQTLTPIIYDNLPTSTSKPLTVADDANVKEVRETLVTTILGAKAILNYLDKQSMPANGSVTSATGINQLAFKLPLPTNATSASSSLINATIGSDHLFEVQIQSLFKWADQYSMITAEVLLRTMANNVTKLENIFKPSVETVTDYKQVNDQYQASRLRFSPKQTNRLSMIEIWTKFCSSPVDSYLVLESQLMSTPESINNSLNKTITNINSSSIESKENHRISQVYAQMSEGKEIICNFEWEAFYEQLVKGDPNKILSEYPERQLTRIALTKWGQVLDVMFIESKHIKQLPKFFYMDYWQLFRDKLPQISPLKEQPSNLVWIWKGFERVVGAMDVGTELQTTGSLLRILDQLNCGLDAVKGGLSWENIANIYQDKQDILAAHSTINNGFALASIGVNTFLAHKKFQKFLDKLVKPRVGLNAFCEIRDKQQLESIFSIPDGQDFLAALESFQELICDTNFEQLAQNINPISVCYQLTSATGATQLLGGNASISATSIAAKWQAVNNQTAAIASQPLADLIDRFFKLASLAILDAKLVAASEAKPPILDKSQWINFWNWWSEQAEPQPKSGIALAVVRAFQTMDSINSNHVVWKALFRSIHEVSEIAAYLLRAVEKRHQEGDLIGAASRLSLVREAATQLDTAMRSTTTTTAAATTATAANNSSLSLAGKQSQQQQLASTLSNIMFPEVNNFISFRTFKQLRYIRSISDYFTSTSGAQESVCSNGSGDSRSIDKNRSKFELIGFKLNSNEKVFTLLCHYHSSQWLTVLNIVISTRTTSIPKKVNYMTKYLSIFTRNYKENDKLESFIHSQQLENIENVANTTVSYFLATSQSFKSLSFSKISNISWHSLPNLLDSIDRHLCASKFEQGTFNIPVYEPKKPELETVLCRLPQWNITQVYQYLSENFDLQNMISLITAQQAQSNNSLISSTKSNATTTPTTTTNITLTSAQLKPQSSNNQTIKTTTCVTPFKFASRWLKIAQETVDDVMSKSSRDKIRKCLSSARKGQSVYSQTLRYVKFVNSIFTSIDDLTVSDSWHVVKRTWNSISYLILSQNPSYISKLY